MSKSRKARLVSGLNVVDCKRMARDLGCTMEHVSGTGDIRFSHPSMPKPVNVNGRRKDAPRALTAWINGLVSVLTRDSAA